MKVLGIDEAGRGPVIGPLVIAGVLIEKEKEKELIKLGVKDSKKLTREEREILFEQILKIIDDYRVRVIPPQKIDYYVEHKSLNQLEIEVMAEIIKELDCDEVYVDSPSRNTEKVIMELEILSEKKIKIVAENKADKKYPTVSAASIIAKVIRDREIEKIKKETGIDFGSGYPSDPKTLEAIKKHYEKLKPYIRKTWRTVEKCLQRTLFDFI